MARLLMALAGLALAAPMLAGAGGGFYREPVWFRWETAELDVLVIPPAHGQLVNGNGLLGSEMDPQLTEATPLNSYLRAILDAIRDWQRAMDAFGPGWMRGVSLRTWVVGLDEVPQENLTHPEILVMTDESKAYILGFSMSTRPCVVLPSKMTTQSFSPTDMYNIAGHEFGHCLGLDHVDEVPVLDIMNARYSHGVGAPFNPRNCMSNLNVATMALAFGPLFGEPTGLAAVMPVESYQVLSC